MEEAESYYALTYSASPIDLLLACHEKLQFRVFLLRHLLGLLQSRNSFHTESLNGNIKASILRAAVSCVCTIAARDIHCVGWCSTYNDC